ncbi:hypothetical protein AVEN_43213-1 [Araneus ventricosus]|uniref:Uncharacterized protein n=1 Tax=Araneus ventricosus TaxID=182803 RepID=A0A4Y2K5J9_ARAVE|nr:hypothetical protein AVEN_43213-1 [Araneus ventricosus]
MKSFYHSQKRPFYHSQARSVVAGEAKPCLLTRRLLIHKRVVPSGRHLLVTGKPNHQACPAEAPGFLNDSDRYDRSSAEAEVLVAYHWATAGAPPVN